MLHRIYDFHCSYFFNKFLILCINFAGPGFREINCHWRNQSNKDKYILSDLYQINLPFIWEYTKFQFLCLDFELDFKQKMSPRRGLLTGISKLYEYFLVINTHLVYISYIDCLYTSTCTLSFYRKLKMLFITSANMCLHEFFYFEIW